MITQEQVDWLVDLARECDTADPMDWGTLKVTEDQAYQMMASNLLDQMATLDEDQRLHISLATTTKLLVENFVLNLKLKGAEDVLKNI
jgi:hypothetical protein|tara:strand:- start:280 stop:543 length:264 start_codon:yes stop_codon:yes gene_type:complete